MLTRKSFVVGLENTENVNEHYAFIDSCAKYSDVDYLRDIFAEICISAPRHRIPDWAAAAILE